MLSKEEIERLKEDYKYCSKHYANTDDIYSLIDTIEAKDKQIVELQTNRYNIIFLDIDGVMNSNNHLVESKAHEYLEFDPICVESLKKILKETNAKIVISSTWRIKRSLEELKRIFSIYDISNYIIGVTPNLWKERGHEIQEYIDIHKNIIKKFVIIDDDSDMEHLMPYLVKINYLNGLTNEEAERVINYFKEESK
jgi:hypothetical protein